MAQGPGLSKGALHGDVEGALSGDVKLDDGERVYVAEGDLVAGKYCVERILGVGGVGFVVAARHADLGGHFALKFLKKRFLNDKTIVERFTREARAACRIKSEYIARVYDVGTHGHAPFIVMEHLMGRDLAAVLAERGAFVVSEAVEYAVQACAALAVAHASGIVHRDIKPENLFLVDEEGVPTIKLLDFGISKIALASEHPTDEWGPEGEPITGTLICGTPFYMSPEQIRSTASVDARSDVWSLGMVLYELLSATTAFHGETPMDVCTAILDQEARRLSDFRPEVPPALADVVARCLQKDPTNRFTNVAELAVALLPFAPPRALAIAEGSAWIRRAAIHTLGSINSVGYQPVLGPGDGRVSGAYGAAIAPNSSKPARPSPTPTQGSSRSLRALGPARRWVAFAAVGAAIVVGSVAASGAALLLRNRGGAAPKLSTAKVASATSEPIVAARPPRPPPSAAPPDEHWIPSAPSHSLPAPTPSTAPVAPAMVVHPLAPAHPRVTPMRTQPPARLGPPSSPSSSESSSAAPPITPPHSPGRPDLGY